MLNGITGSIGLAPTLAALDAGRVVALANKESLIAGGSLVRSRARPGQLVPVDSEHSALAQCLRGGRAEEIRRLILTASGGPFRGRERAELTEVTPDQALAHPTWNMGPVVTINSATMVNKALEVIEAHELFNIAYDNIDVVVHPQSVVHSMVEFIDGSTLAQASPPDMRLPIALALSWPERVPDVAPGSTGPASNWHFEPLEPRPSPPSGWPAGRPRRRRRRPCSTRPTRCASLRSSPANYHFSASSTQSPTSSEQDGQPGWEPYVVADVVDAESWARTRARGRRTFAIILTKGADVRPRGLLFALAIAASICCTRPATW